MAPTDQRFRANQMPIRQVNLRLVEQLELTSFDCARKLHLERQLRLELLPDRALEHGMAAPSRGLGTRQRKMAVAEELITIVAVRRIDGAADADPDAMLACCRHDRSIEGTREAYGKPSGCSAENCARYRDGELIAAQAGHQGIPSGFRPQPIGDRAQHEVAERMAEQIADLMKAVEVEHQQRHLTRDFLSAGNH